MLKATQAVGLVGALAAVAFPGSAWAGEPLSYLVANGARAYPINSLFYGFLIISLAVVAMAIVLVLAATFRGRRLPADSLPGRLAVQRGESGIFWVTIGVIGTALVLLGSTVWTVVTLADVGLPPKGNPAVRLEIIGHQWWWEVRYLSDAPDRTFTTADEIHIPVGATVLADLDTVDVIHSFWVPRLTGKTELIPGQTNSTWLSASRPGVYRGQCTEYCGRQHAHMGFEVVADTPAVFKDWWDRQLRGPDTPTDEARSDRDMFVHKCGACHTVRGTEAGGVLGPDLSHLAARHTIAAGTLPNNVGYLSGWIADPQHIKPGAMMPRVDLSGPELTAIRRFLESLK